MTDGESLAIDLDDERGRRSFLLSAGGLVLAASGLFVPESIEQAEARTGAYGGRLGGRHGKKRRDRDRRRRRDKKKRKSQGKGKGALGDPGGFLFRYAALSVVNRNSRAPLSCTFYYRPTVNLREWGKPIAQNTESIILGQTYRFAPQHYRVGVLIHNLQGIEGNPDLFAERWNTLGIPQIKVTLGVGLDPPNEKLGNSVVIQEQGIGQREYRVGLQPFPLDVTGARVFDMIRDPDSGDYIEFRLGVT